MWAVPCTLKMKVLVATPWAASPPGGSVREDPPGKNTGVGCHALLQGIFPTQGSNPNLSLSPALAGRFFTASTTWEAHLATWVSPPGGSAGKEAACKAGDLGLIPGLGRSPGEAKGTHSSILAWSSSWGRKELERTELFHFLTFTFPHPRNVFIHLLLFLWLTPGGQSRHSFAVTPSRSPLPPNYTHFALYPVAASPLTLSS